MNTISFIMASMIFVSVTWLTDFEQAKLQAKQRNQMILLSFSGSDWCAPCIKMKREVFDTPQFQDFAAGSLVLVKADFPRHKKNLLDAKQKAHNERLAEQYNPNGKFPLTILLDSNGKLVKEWDGYTDMKPENFIREIQTAGRGK
jgi:thioredoxin-related protein